MRKSKYVGKQFGDWLCTHIGVARVQPVYTQKVSKFTGRKVKSSRPGHQRYYYAFERPTSDGLAMKMIRLEAAQAAQVYKGLKTVEFYAEKKAAKRSQAFKEKVSYSFCD